MNAAVLSEERIMQQLKVPPPALFVPLNRPQFAQADSFVLLAEPPLLPLSSSLPAKWVCRDNLLPMVRPSALPSIYTEIVF
jgi:hypothetical protein